MPRYIDIMSLLEKLKFQDASISYPDHLSGGKLHFEGTHPREWRSNPKYDSIKEETLPIGVSVYAIYLTTGTGVRICVDTAGWYWCKDDDVRGVSKEEQNILTEFGLKRHKDPNSL